MKNTFARLIAAGLVAGACSAAVAAPRVKDTLDTQSYRVQNLAPNYDRAGGGNTRSDDNYYKQLDMETSHGDKG